MSFAAPLALLGAALLALPLWAHLKKQIDLPRVDLPTAHLLANEDADADHRRRIQDFAWLLARLLIVAAIVIAAAAPLLRLPVAYGDGSHRSMCIIVDDSMSMQREGEDGVRLVDAALSRVDEVLSALPEQSEVCLIASGDPARLLVPRTTEFDQIRAGAEALRTPSWRSGDAGGSIALSTRQMADARWDVRSALVLSDKTVEAGWRDWAEFEAGTMEVAYESFAAPTQNYTIGALDVAPSPSDPGALSISVEVVGAPDGEVPLQLTQGTRKQSKTVSLREGRATARFEISDALDPIRVECLANDALPLDDALEVLPPGRQRLRVVAITDRPSELLFLESAFGRARWSSRVALESIEAHRMRGADLEGVTLLIVTDPALLNLSKDVIAAFVREGGSIWIGIRKADSVQSMRSVLGDLLPARTGQVVKEAPPQKLRVTLADGSEAPGGSVRTRLLLEELRPGSRVWASYGDGIAAIAAWKVAEGSVTLFSGPFDDSWNMLPYSPAYLPLITEMMVDTAPTLGRHPNALEIGSKIDLRTPPDTVRLEIRNQDDVWNNVAELASPGIYHVSVETQRAKMRPVPVLDFAMRAPIKESKLTPAEPPTNTDSENVADTGAAYREHPLQRWALVFFALLFFGEGLARLRPKKAWNDYLRFSRQS